MVCICVQTITGMKITCNVETIEEMKKSIELQMGIPQSEQTLLHKGKKLISGELESIEENSIVNLIVSLNGGAKGKKIKNKKKKNKKKNLKKKVKKQILKN